MNGSGCLSACVYTTAAELQVIKVHDLVTQKIHSYEQPVLKASLSYWQGDKRQAG